MIQILMLLVLQSPDLDKAERLYERARYEKALQALGASCDQNVACEKLRALIHIALGNETEARAAFDRILASDPDASLGPDVSPKVKALFASAKEEIAEARVVEMDPIDIRSEDDPWVLKVPAPRAAVVGITVFVAPPESESFTTIDLVKEGDAWVGSLTDEDLEAGQARYYVALQLESGVEVFSGSESEPYAAMVSIIGTGSPFDPTGIGGGSDDKEPLPPWAFWSLVGGGAAVAITGIILAVALSGSDDPGAIEVKVVFQ